MAIKKDIAAEPAEEKDIAAEPAEEKEIIPYSEEDRVEIAPLPYDSERYSHPVTVTWNGKTYQIQRGVSGLKVPRAVSEILDQSERQKRFAGDYMRKAQGIKNFGEFDRQ